MPARYRNGAPSSHQAPDKRQAGRASAFPLATSNRGRVQRRPNKSDDVGDPPPRYEVVGRSTELHRTQIRDALGFRVFSRGA